MPDGKLAASLALRASDRASDAARPATAPVAPSRWRSAAFWHRAIRAASLTVFVLALGLTLARGQGTAVPVALVGAAIGAILVLRLYRGEERELLLTLFFAALALRLLVAVVIHPYLLHRLVTGSRDVTTVGVMFEDDRVFDVVAWALARAWAGTIEGVDRNDGYLINNFTYATAWLYYLLGHELMAAKFLNCALGALVPVATFSLGKELGGDRVARFAAVAAAVFPSLFLWSTLNLKDVMIVLLLAATMLAAIRFARAPTLLAAVLALVPFFLIESLRVYVFYLLGWLMPLTFFVLNGAPWRRRLAIGVPFAAAVLSVVYLTNETQALGLRYLTDKRLEALDSSRAFGANAAESGIEIERVPRSESGSQIQLVNAPRVLPYVLFAPFPWQARRPRDLAAVPEMLAWYGIMALAVLALVVYGRRRWRELFLPVLYGAGMVAIFSIIEGNVGTIFRHRSMLMPPAFVLAGLGLVWLQGWWAERRGAARPSEPIGVTA